MISAQSFHCIGIGTDGICTGTDDSGMRFDGTGTGTEGTDSTSTDAYDSDTILSHFQFWILRLSAIPKKMTDSVNNIGLRDASASKNHHRRQKSPLKNKNNFINSKSKSHLMLWREMKKSKGEN